jgi:regulator of nucleoside diphosphate kinase
MTHTRNTMTRTLPRIFVSSTDFERLTARLGALPVADADRLQGLADELDRADVRDSRAMPADVVVMGSTVRFAIGTGPDLTLTLVYPDEVEGRPDRISVFAPVGSALLGLPVGARIEWPRPDGVAQLITIKEVGRASAG